MNRLAVENFHIAQDYGTNQFTVSFQVCKESGQAVREFANRINREKKYAVEVKEWREKRSLDANAYCWVLLDKLAAKLNIPKVDIYRQMIVNIGGNCEPICVKNIAVDKVCQGWERHGLGWCTETSKSKIEGCTNVILYYGSSSYDTEQMSRLIQNIVDECKAQGIETRTPAEIANLISLWGAEQ